MSLDELLAHLVTVRDHFARLTPSPAQQVDLRNKTLRMALEMYQKATLAQLIAQGLQPLRSEGTVEDAEMFSVAAGVQGALLVERDPQVVSNSQLEAWAREMLPPVRALWREAAELATWLVRGPPPSMSPGELSGRVSLWRRRVQAYLREQLAESFVNGQFSERDPIMQEVVGSGDLP